MTPILVVPPVTTLLYPVEITAGKRDSVIDRWNIRARAFNRGRLR